ncbi:hypothetical protein [Yokenella regensburgei]|uniref:hypothetical protein n=1 Tax=Yokenella regensburgei TaxID=158877 RepID=UPI001375ED1F|nr:hypothetical protein [Yokenella regensburgei]KAF1368757.1 hypothetical protein FHR25_002507 [Yokenella regensburgei]
MSTKQCRIAGNKISPCETLARATEYGNPRPKSKGLFVPERVNIKTGEPGTDIAQLHSGAFVGAGAALNFCPFCGESLKAWEK